MNDKIKQDNDTRLQDNETCVTEHIPQVTLRLTIDYSKFQKFPLDQWYAKAKKILRADTRQEVIYYAHLFISIYEEKPQKLEPLIGVWLNAPKYLPEKISNSQYTLADGVLGTTLQIMLILQNSKQ